MIYRLIYGKEMKVMTKNKHFNPLSVRFEMPYDTMLAIVLLELNHKLT